MGSCCELSSSPAAVYCHADAARLCWTCDAQVHSANFLVARHTRFVLCYGASSTPGAPSCCNSSSICAGCSSRSGDGDNLTFNLDKLHSSDPLASTSEYVNNAGFPILASKRNTRYSLLYPRPKGTADEFVNNEPVTDFSSYKPARKENSYHHKNSNACGCSQLLEEVPEIDPGVLFHSHSSESGQENCKRKRMRHSNEVCSVLSSDITSSQIILQGPSGQGHNPSVSTASSKRRRHHSQNYVISEVLLALQLSPDAKAEALLWKWHDDLGLIKRETISLAMHLLQRVPQMVGTRFSGTKLSLPSLAVCLWVAAKLSERSDSVPVAGKMSQCTGVPEPLLLVYELRLRKSFGWKVQEQWADSFT